MKFNHHLNILAPLAMLVAVLSFSGAGAQSTGVFVGFNAGPGGGALQFTDAANRTVSDETGNGLLGGARLGFAFSNSWALSLEGTGFLGSKGESNDWHLGTGVLALTWHPGGRGFFLRAGGGVGGGQYKAPGTAVVVNLRDQSAGFLGLGYDWWLNDHTSLGLAVDSMVIDAGGSLGFEDDQVGAAGVSLQLNLFL